MPQRSLTRGLMRLGLGALLLGSVVALGMAGETQKAPVKQYTGQIKSVKIEKCGLQPGTCEGSIVLAPKGGPEVALAILPGTWIQRGGQLVTIDALRVGNEKLGIMLLQPALRPACRGTSA